MFEKAFKAIAALVACGNPLSVEQENSIFGMLSNQVPGMIGSITSSNETSTIHVLVTNSFWTPGLVGI